MNTLLSRTILLGLLLVPACSRPAPAQPAPGQARSILVVHFADPYLYVTETVPASGASSVYEALHLDVEPGRRTFFVVETGRAPGWVLEVEAGANRRAFDQALQQVAGVLEKATPGKPGEHGAQTVRQIQYRLLQESNGLAVFEHRVLGTSEITAEPALPLDTDKPASPVPVVQPREQVFESHVPYRRSWLRVLLYFMLLVFGTTGVAALAVPRLAGTVLRRFRRNRRQPLRRAPDGQGAGAGLSAPRRREQPEPLPLPRTNSSRTVQGHPRSRRSAGPLLGIAFLLAAGSVVGPCVRPLAARVPDTVCRQPSLIEVVDVSGSARAASLAQARRTLAGAAADGRCVELIAFGDSTWVVGRAVSLRQVDSLLTGLPTLKHTRLAGAVLFVAERVADLRRSGLTGVQVVWHSDWINDDGGNEALGYVPWPDPPATVSPGSVVQHAQHRAASGRGYTTFGAGALLGLLLSLPLFLRLQRRRSSLRLDRLRLAVRYAGQTRTVTFLELLEQPVAVLGQDPEALVEAAEAPACRLQAQARVAEDAVELEIHFEADEPAREDGQEERNPAVAPGHPGRDAAGLVPASGSGRGRRRPLEI